VLRFSQLADEIPLVCGTYVNLIMKNDPALAQLAAPADPAAPAQQQQAPTEPPAQQQQPQPQLQAPAPADPAAPIPTTTAEAVSTNAAPQGRC